MWNSKQGTVYEPTSLFGHQFRWGQQKSVPRSTESSKSKDLLKVVGHLNLFALKFLVCQAAVIYFPWPGKSDLAVRAMASLSPKKGNRTQGQLANVGNVLEVEVGYMCHARDIG